MKKPKQTVSLLLSLLLILFTLPGASLAVPSDSDRAAEDAPLQIELAVGETIVVTAEGTLEIAESSEPDVASAVVRHTEAEIEVPYAGTASASQAPLVIDGFSHSADLVLDGKTDTYYWSKDSQKSGDWVMVDLGAEVRFGAIRITSVTSDYCRGASVEISSDAANWIKIGNYSGSTELTAVISVPSSVDSFRYIRISLKSPISYLNWKLAEIEWGSYSSQTFAPAPISGTVSMGSKPVTEITFTGLSVGTASYVIGDRTYLITVTAADHVHQWQTTSETPPSCTEDGALIRTCSVCGETETKTIPASGHDYQSEITKPTCTDGGYTTHTCRRCGSGFIDALTEPLDHDWGEWRTITEAACESPGLEIRVCGNDPSHTETRETAALGHDYQYEVVAPTCTTDGYTQITCIRCGTGERVYSTFALGHDYVTTKVDATCTEGGYRIHTCRRCGVSYQDSVTQPLGHQYLESITEPTCTSPGFTAHTCVRCGSRYTDTPTEPLDHDWGEWQILADPTCIREGSRIRICTRDSAHMETAPVPALGHDYHEIVIAPTCTEEGYTLHSCSRCGDSFRDAPVPAAGHRYHQVSAEYPTEHTFGSLLVICGACDEQLRIDLPFVNSEDYLFSAETACYTWRNPEYGDVTFSLRGDVSGDGTVDLVDVSLLYRWYTGRAELSEAALCRGDMNGSLSPDLRDVALIFRWFSSFN